MAKNKTGTMDSMKKKIEFLMKELNVSRDTATIIAYLDSIGYRVYEIKNLLDK